MIKDIVIAKELIQNKDGSLTLTGTKLSTDESVTLTCTASDLCKVTLRPNNNLGKVNQQIELFKLTDIPGNMTKRGWANAALLNSRWLNEPALAMKDSDKGNYATSNPQLDYYNPQKFNHQWLSKFKRYNTAIQFLATGSTNQRDVQNLIVKYLNRERAFADFNFKYQNYSSSSNYKYLNDVNSLKLFHNKWQINYSKIDEGAIDKSITYASNGFLPDDLWAAFGSVAIYAAIGDYTLSLSNDKKWFAIKIESLICYAIDSYDFMVGGDNPDDYLGHWNKTEFQANKISEKISKGRLENLNIIVGLDKDITGTFTPENILYPVYNHHYQAYRKQYGKGRDMIVWTKPEKIDISKYPSNMNTFHVAKSALTRY